MSETPARRFRGAAARSAAIAAVLVGLACGVRDPATDLVESGDPAVRAVQPTPVAPADPPVAVTPAPPVKIPTLEELLAAHPATAAELSRVAAVLRSDTRKDFAISGDQHRAERLADLGDRRLGLLAHFLTDYDLGDDAAETMNFLDRDRAAPLLFASMPRSDRNVQFRGLGRFNERIRDGERVCCLAEMHAAAVRCLEADTNADAAERALVSVGLTGGPTDFPLLLRYFESAHPTDYWRLRLRRAAGAALARLGSAPHLQHIEDALAAEVPRVIDSARAIDLSAVLDQAAFAGAKRYLPLLCRHLDDPFPRDIGHAIPPMPAQRAAVAIDVIARQTPPSRASEDVTQARAWCDSRG